MPRTAADKRNRTMSVVLHMAHNNHLQKVTHMQAVSCGVKAYIKRDLLISEKLADFFLMRCLRNKSAFL